MADHNKEKNRTQEKSSPLTCYFWIRDDFLPATECTPAQANVLLALAGYGNPDGTSIRPGRPNLIRATKYDRGTVREAIKFWLYHPSGVLVEISKGNGKTHASVFHIIMPDDAKPKGADAQPKGADQTPLSDEQRGGPDTPLSENGVAKGWQRGGKGVSQPPIPSTEVPKHQSQKKESAANPAAPGVPSIALPDWVPVPEWVQFLRFRRQLKKPLTEYAQELLVKKLYHLRESGHDPAAVLEQSILNGWTGLFPLRQNGNEPEHERLGLSRFGNHTAADHNARLLRNWENCGFVPQGCYDKIKQELLARGTTFADDPVVLSMCQEIGRQLSRKH